MNARQFFDRVAQLCHFQKEYFKTRSREALQQSIALEKEIDAEIERVNKIMAAKQSPDLFNH